MGAERDRILNIIGKESPLNSIKDPKQKIDKIKKVLHFYKQWNNIRDEEYGPINKLKKKRDRVKTMRKTYRTNNQIETSKKRKKCEDDAEKNLKKQ